MSTPPGGGSRSKRPRSTLVTACRTGRCTRGSRRSTSPAPSRAGRSSLTGSRRADRARTVECPAPARRRRARSGRVLERAADGRPRVPALGQLHHLPGGVCSKTWVRTPLSGATTPMGAGIGREAAPGGADAGVDHDEEYAAGREVRAGGGQLQRRGPDVVGLDVVSHVHEGGVGADAQYDAPHRARVVIAGTEVAQQRNDWTSHLPVPPDARLMRSSLSWPASGAGLGPRLRLAPAPVTGLPLLHVDAAAEPSRPRRWRHAGP